MFPFLSFFKFLFIRLCVDASHLDACLFARMFLSVFFIIIIFFLIFIFSSIFLKSFYSLYVLCSILILYAMTLPFSTLSNPFSLNSLSLFIFQLSFSLSIHLYVSHSLLLLHHLAKFMFFCLFVCLFTLIKLYAKYNNQNNHQNT